MDGLYFNGQLGSIGIIQPNEWITYVPLPELISRFVPGIENLCQEMDKTLGEVEELHQKSVELLDYARDTLDIAYGLKR